MLNTVICGNSENILREIITDSINLVITSPPYDSNRDYNGYTFNFEKIANELFRIVQIGGVIVWIVGDTTLNGSETGTSFRQALYFKDLGFNLHDTMIWHKRASPFPNKTRYNQIFDYMFILSKGKPSTINLIQDKKNKCFGEAVHGTNRLKNGKTKKLKNLNQKIREFGIRENIWSISNPGIKNNKHPAVFPYTLAYDHIITWSKPGDLVLDPFCGSGTALKAAKDLKRNYIGVDISEDYCKISRDRLQIENRLFE